VTVSGVTVVTELSSLVDVPDCTVEVAVLVVVVAVFDVLCAGCAIKTATRLANPPTPAAAATALLRFSARSRDRRSASDRALVGVIAASRSRCVWHDRAGHR
jgi:uncharacterized lipoprotein YajG